VPVTQDGDSRVKLLYRIGEVECFDENTGENPKPVQVRKINSRLMFEHEDVSDMEVLPLLRIVRATGEDVGLPKEDPEFVPPCMLLSGSPVLRELVRDLVNQVEATRKELVHRVMTQGITLDTMRGPQIEQMMRLRTLNHYSARLPSLIHAPVVAPFDIYIELRGLLGELAALELGRDPFETAAYQHDNLFLCFRELSGRIRDLLKISAPDSFLKLPFKDVGGVLAATFTEEHFSRPNAYFLCVQTGVDPTALVRYVEDGDKFKLMPLSLVTRAIRGIELKEERVAPMGLPARNDLHYFRLERAKSARMWQQIQTEKAAAIRWIGGEIDWSGANFTLYMTVPSGGSK